MAAALSIHVSVTCELPPAACTFVGAAGIVGVDGAGGMAEDEVLLPTLPPQAEISSIESAVHVTSRRLTVDFSEGRPCSLPNRGTGWLSPRLSRIANKDSQVC